MSDVTDYYGQYDEEQRLIKDSAHALEYETTDYYLGQLLKPGMRVLEAGAGTGRYSFALAQRGFAVTAVDIVPAHIQAMNEKAAATGLAVDIRLGDARELPKLVQGAFDAVLCLGPLYHLREAAEREAALRACLAVLKPGGLLFAAYINRQAVHALTFRGSEEPEAERAVLNDALEKGYSDSPGHSSFYFSTPQETEQLMQSLPLHKLYHIGTDGIAYLMAEMLTDQPGMYRYWAEHHKRTCANETLLGYSLHGLYIARKAQEEEPGPSPS